LGKLLPFWGNRGETIGETFFSFCAILRHFAVPLILSQIFLKPRIYRHFSDFRYFVQWSWREMNKEKGTLVFRAVFAVLLT